MTCTPNIWGIYRRWCGVSAKQPSLSWYNAMQHGWSISAALTPTTGSIIMMFGNSSISIKICFAWLAAFLLTISASTKVLAVEQDDQSFTVAELMHTLAQV